MFVALVSCGQKTLPESYVLFKYCFLQLYSYVRYYNLKMKLYKNER